MRALLFLSFLFFYGNLIAQNEPSANPEVWIHGYLDFQNTEEVQTFQGGQNGATYTYQWSEKGLKNVNLGIYKLGNKGFYHELSLTTLEFGVRDVMATVTEPPLNIAIPIEGDRAEVFRAGFQIESGLTTPKWLGRFFRPGIGLGAIPEFAYFRSTPNTSQRFPFRDLSFGLGLNLVPRLHFRLSERIGLITVVPIRIGTVDFSYNKNFDPALPDEQRSVNTTSFEIKPKVDFWRLGVAVKL